MTGHLTGVFIANVGLPVSAAAPVSLPGVVLAVALLAALVVIVLLALPKRGEFRILKGGLGRGSPRKRLGGFAHRWLPRTS